MRYYPDIEIDFKSVIENCKQQMKYEKLNEEMLLTEFGIYKYFKNELYCFKLNSDENSTILNKYVNNFTIVKTPDLWKRIFMEYRLPYEHFKMKLTKYIFLPFEKKEFKFVIEIYENNKIDYYFETYETDENNFFLKENIGSFLKNLK